MPISVVASGSRNGVAPSDGRGVVRTGPNTLYAFVAVKTFEGVAYKKSVDNGLTWSLPVFFMHTGQNVMISFAIWFDKWTAGDSGTKIHVCVADSSIDDVYYFSLDTASDTIAGDTLVFAGVSFTVAAHLSICKARGGNLYVGWDGDGGTEAGFVRSTDSGGTWGDRTTFLEGGGADFFALTPGNYADANDIDCVFWDISADELSLKTYDDSANSWAEASIATSMVDAAKAVASPQFSAVVRHSDGHLLVVAWSSTTSTGDLKCWDVNGGGSVSAKTDVVANAGDGSQCVHLYIDQLTDALYVFYIGKSDRSQVTTGRGLYYKVSTDGGTTWGAEVELIGGYYISTAANFVHRAFSGPVSGNGFETRVLMGGVDAELAMPVSLPPVSGSAMLGQGVRRGSYF